MERRDTLKWVGSIIGAALVARATAGWGFTLGRHTPRGIVTTQDPDSLRGGETRPILRFQYFRGQAAEAYRVASEIPDVLDHLYCYCECETHSGHKSLKSCFTDLHGANCDICQEEALLAWRLNKQRLPVLEIRKRVDQVFMRS